MIHGTLGPNYKKKIEDIKEQYVSQVRRAYKKDMTTFRKIEEKLRADLQRKIEYYERFCIQQRELNQLKPFNWELETPDRVRSAFEYKSGRSNVPRTYLERLQAQERINKRSIPTNTDHMSIRELAETMQLKPQYQGANHPLESNQVVRQANPAPRSFAAQSALRQFETTGKITMPDNTVRIEQSNRDHIQWKRDIPEPKNAAFKAEPLEYLIDQVSKKLKLVFDDPSDENFKNIMQGNPE